MAEVVLVHGIGLEQDAADTLEPEWLAAVAGGVRIAGDASLADRLRHDIAERHMVSMAFYGDLFLSTGAQGGGERPDRWDAATAALAEQLAGEWLAAAAHYAADPRDRANAARELAQSYASASQPQGRTVLRPALNGLARTRWFAPAAMGIAGSLVYRALGQVSRYLTNDTLRDHAQQRVLDVIDSDTRLVIAHSLGTVVAYEALHRQPWPVALVTLGSPLALRTIVYQRLRPQPPHVPACVTSWRNFADRDDLVAARINLQPYFPPAAGRDIQPVDDPSLNNGSSPHDALHYLVKSAVGAAVAAALHQRSAARW